MFGQSLLSAFGIACTTDTDQLFATDVTATSLATYQLNNATTSIPSNTYPGTASNITYAAGKFGNAAVFNGSSSKILVNSSIYDNTANTSLTWSSWIKFSNVYTSGFRAIVGAGSAGRGSIAINMYGSSSGISTSLERYYNNTQRYSGSYATAALFSYSANVWYHLAITYDGSTSNATVFINGTQQGSTYNLNVVNSQTTGNETVFGLYDSNGYGWQGEIDQIRTFNSVLPQSAITALYNETTTTATSASVDYQLANPNSIAYYKMADATDQLGNYNGTATNVNFNTEGKFGFAGAFNGSSSYITANTLPAIGTGDFGFSCWFYQNSGNQQGALFSTTTQWFAANGNNNPKVLMVTDDTVTKKGDTAYAQGVWNHAVFTRASGVLKIYQNGSEVFSGSYTDSWDMTQFGIGVARAVGSRVYYFNGKIDQIRLYNAALSAADVSTLYKEIECEPAAINALANFNTVLYTGNASTNQISTVGFAPGFTWIKARNTATSPEAHDIVRGEPSRLWVDNTYAASTAYNGFVKLTSNGFDLNNVGSGGNVNRAYNYVAWNWKAPLANLSTGFNGSSSKIVLPKFPTLTGDVSVSGWVKLGNTTTSNRLRFVELNVTGSGYAGTLMTLYKPSNGEWLVRAGNGTTSDANILTHTYQLTQGVWYNICFTRNTSTNVTTFYVNNVQQDQETVSVTASIPSNATSIIGDINYSSSYQYNWLGEMSQIRIFDDVLTTNEVSDIYTEPAASNNTLNYPAGAGCVAAYPLQTDAVDLSGNYSGASSNVTFGQPGYLTGNTDGTITSTVASNQEAGFSIVQWTGDGSNNTIGHGLNAIPEMIFYKSTSAVQNWTVLTTVIDGSADGLVLNDSSAKFNITAAGALPTATIFGNVGFNSSMIAYCFTSIPGYSKIGSYVGTNSVGNFQYTGFQPSFVLIKSSSTSSTNWVVIDNKRDSGDAWLYANTNSVEYDDGNTYTELNSTGFTVNGNASYVNGSGGTYIYLAIA